MDNPQLKQLFERYESGNANETERALVEAWYRSYRGDEAEISETDAIELAAKMQAHIRQNTITPTMVRMPFWRAAAAAFLIGVTGLAGWGLFGRKAETLLVTGSPELKKVQLPDGSQVWINSASRFRFPKHFSGKLREVTLEEGEAFFSVIHDSEHSFIVHTAKLDVQVLGTSFDIKAYQQLDQISISVATGKVGVTREGRSLGMLTPGQQLDYLITSDQTQIKLNGINDASWTTGATNLRDANFNELALAFKNNYGLTLKTNSAIIANYRFTLTLLQKLPAEQAVELAAALHQSRYRKEGNAVVFY